MTKTFRYDKYNFEVEIGKFAQQANGAVWLKLGDGTVVLATACATPSKEFPGFLPLSVDYREQYSAAGKIPGGYYKREGKSSDREVLTSRLIDRALRPLFPLNYFDQVQVLSTVYSVDKEYTPNTISLLVSSLALVISDIPFLEPIGVVEIARVDGNWIMNPIYSQMIKSDVRLVIAGTQEGVSMIEGSANQISEADFLDIMFKAHEEIKEMVAWQLEIAAEVGKQKAAVKDVYNWNSWEEKAFKFLTEERVKQAYIQDKVARNEYFNQLREDFGLEYATALEEAEMPQSVINYIFDSVFKDRLTELAFITNKRIDGRSADQIRDISVEVGLLPFTHGSALFMRGRTQALVTVTLGSGQDEQRIESLMSDTEDDGSFMLHYNFPPFSAGEVRPMRGPGRREVGHGHLAASSLKYVRPSKEEFPYTIRVVADILEVDGSSSMATVCGSTMALMQAGVPIKKMVGGIAMGLLRRKDSSFMVLSDMSGIEDAFGFMDFKVVGTSDGITAIQMDTKHKGGLTRDIFEQALEQARQGRLYILGEMSKVMSEPNKTLSDLVPKVITFKINTDKIGAVIGTGGKTIREIIDQTGTSIDIESDGIVKIFGGPSSRIDMAVNWVKTLAGAIERGAIYEGKIKRFVEFGMFVELVPGLDGLVHISNIPKHLQKTFSKHFKLDDIVKVQVGDYDEVTGRVSLKLLTDAQPPASEA